MTVENNILPPKNSGFQGLLAYRDKGNLLKTSFPKKYLEF